jgi:actin cytoskeleton-regulatory complex protein SLA1
MFLQYVHRFNAFVTLRVQEIDKKGKKKKGTLGIGNGAMFFASDSDKTPVQQWPTASITVSESEKPKHVMLEVGGSSPMVLHFNAGSKETAEAIIEKLESSKSKSAESSAQSNSSAPSAPESVPLVTTTQVAKLKQKKSVNFSEAPEVIAPSPADDDDSYGSASEGENTADVDAPTDDTQLGTSRMDERNATAARAETLAIAAARTRQQQHDRENEGTDTPRYSGYIRGFRNVAQ